MSILRMLRPTKKKLCVLFAGFIILIGIGSYIAEIEKQAPASVPQRSSQIARVVTPTPRPTPKPTATPTPKPTPTPTPTPKPTATLTPMPTPIMPAPTATPVPIPTVIPVAQMPSPESTSTPVPTPTPEGIGVIRKSLKVKVAGPALTGEIYPGEEARISARIESEFNETLDASVQIVFHTELGGQHNLEVKMDGQTGTYQTAKVPPSGKSVHIQMKVFPGAAETRFTKIEFVVYALGREMDRQAIAENFGIGDSLTWTYFPPHFNGGEKMIEEGGKLPDSVIAITHKGLVDQRFTIYPVFTVDGSVRGRGWGSSYFKIDYLQTHKYIYIGSGVGAGITLCPASRGESGELVPVEYYATVKIKINPGFPFERIDKIDFIIDKVLEQQHEPNRPRCY